MEERRGTVARNAQELRAQMTDPERAAISRLLDLAWQTREIETKHEVILQAVRNFLGYVEMAIHDGTFGTITDWFVETTTSELDILVKTDASYADYAKEYKILQARGVAAYKRVLRV